MPGLGDLLTGLTSFIDSRKRIAKSNLSAPPMDLLNMMGARAEEASKGLLGDAQATRSVMPGVRDAGNESLTNKMMDMGLLGITAYHGSPHKFDKFDMSKIGTGEGAQAYGHGLYFAEAPDVAKQYQKTLAGDGFRVGDKVFDPSTLKHLNVRTLVRNGDLDGAISKAQAIASSNSPIAALAADDLATLAAIKSRGGLQKNTGTFYKVDIPDEAVSKMLDWDKPLSQQPESVRKALEAIPFAKRGVHLNDENSVQDLLNGLVRGKFNNPQNARRAANASTQLRTLGIPGIKYLDQGSRGKGGTSNFVVFDDQLPKIIGRE